MCVCCICVTVYILSFPGTTSSSCFTPWGSSGNWWPFMLPCRLYADLECTPWGSPTSITCPLTTTTASSSSCCPTSHVRRLYISMLWEYMKRRMTPDRWPLSEDLTVHISPHETSEKQHYKWSERIISRVLFVMPRVRWKDQFLYNVSILNMLLEPWDS